MNYATGCCELIKETRELTIEEKAINYDKLMETINDLERMYTKALDKYPNSIDLIKEKLNVIKLIKE